MLVIAVCVMMSVQSFVQIGPAAKEERAYIPKYK